MAVLLTDVPLLREGIIDTCLLILHDWSGNILCEQEELDAERGVIREEWRTGRTAGRRNSFEMYRTLYMGTPYATRSVIGDTSIINNFTQKDILDFYHDWYRPNLQAVVIVGDFDLDQMENKVKNLFSTIKNPANPKVKPEFNIPDNIEPITNVYKEAELTSNSASIYIKFPEKYGKESRNTEESVRYNTVHSYIAQMLNARLSEAAQLPDAKFTGARIGIGSLVGDREVFYMSMAAKNNDLTAGFDQALTIVEQARRFGFTASELSRAKANQMQSYESNFAERGSKNHGQYRGVAYNHFMYNTPIMNEEQSLNLAKKLDATIQVDELNKRIQEMVVFGPNTIVYASGPDKADVALPDDEMLMIVMYGVEKKQLTPYEDVATDKPLIAKAPKAGKVSKTVENKELGATEWTLSNGMKIVLKPTTFMQDEISMSGFSWGGLSLLSQEDWAATRNVLGVVANSGVGEFNRTTLNKMLAGKKIGVSPSISELAQHMNGHCSPKDLETMLQLTYLYFTAPRVGQDEFDLAVANMRNGFKNRNANPATTLSDTVISLLNNYNPRVQAMTDADFDKLNYAKIKEVYMQRFANPGAFTFTFVGNIDPKTAKPLIEKYLGGLKGNKKEDFKDNNLYPVNGEVKRHFTRNMSVSKATVRIYYTGEMLGNLENNMAMDYLGRILRLRYTEEIREKRGGTYGTGVSAYISETPKERFTLTISFDTDPKMMDELVGVVHDELKKIAENGPLAEDMQKSSENMKSRFEQNQKENAYWRGVLTNYYMYGQDTHSNWETTFSKTDAQAIQNLASEILKQKNMIEVVMLPE